MTLAIAQNEAGQDGIRGELARSSILFPVGICNILQHSSSLGEQYNFLVAIAIAQFCGPCRTVNCVDSSNTSSRIASLQNFIQTLSCVLMISESADDNGMNENHKKTQLSLKYESLLALEALSSNELLHGTLIYAFHSLAKFLM